MWIKNHLLRIFLAAIAMVCLTFVIFCLVQAKNTKQPINLGTSDYDVWNIRLGSYIETARSSGYNILINGVNKYLNFNTISGESGYGIRDNGGTIEVKNSGGSWSGIGSGGSMTALPEGQIYVGNASSAATATSSVTVASNGLVSINGPLKLNSFSSNPQVYADSDANTGLVMSAPDTMSLMSGGTNHLLINSMGYVGIGTSAPAYQLDVYGNVRFDGDFVSENIDNSGVATTSKLCFTSGQCMTAPSTEGSNITLFHWNEAAEISGYEKLMTYPDEHAEVDESCSATAGYCATPIDSYVSTTTELAITSISAGMWNFHYYTYVSSASGVSKLEARVYKRNTAGTETLLFVATSSEINSLTITETEFQSYQPEYAFLITDRIVVKVYGWTDAVTARNVHLIYGGDVNYSHIETPINVGDFDHAVKSANETISGQWTYTNLLTTSNASTSVLSVSGDTYINGSLGIGINPGQKLHVLGDATISNTNPSLYFTGTDGTVNDMGIRYNSSGAQLAFRDNGGLVDRMVINRTGNVGIGTGSPSFLFDVAGDSRIYGNLYVTGAFIGNLTGTASGNLISGGTLTTNYHCRYDGTGIDCDRLEDASGACAANSVCMGGHTHVGVNETYGSGWNGDTDTPEKDDVYDYLHLMDTDDDGAANNLDTDAVDAITEIAAALKDGSGDCSSGLICLGDHSHSTYAPLASPTFTGLVTIGNASTTVLSVTTSYLSALLGTIDAGGATSFEIPNGTAPTVDTAGEIALDTTDNQLLVADSGGAVFVAGTKVQKIWSATIASTSVDFINAGLLPVPAQLDGYTITAIRCYVLGGTSKVIAVEDASANSSEDITCGTTLTSDDGSITNATYTAGELSSIDFGATSGAVNYVSISVFGTWTRE